MLRKCLSPEWLLTTGVFVMALRTTFYHPGHCCTARLHPKVLQTFILSMTFLRQYGNFLGQQCSFGRHAIWTHAHVGAFTDLVDVDMSCGRWKGNWSSQICNCVKRTPPEIALVSMVWNSCLYPSVADRCVPLTPGNVRKRHSLSFFSIFPEIV